MATRNIVPRTGSQGGIGTDSKPWKEAIFDTGSFQFISGSLTPDAKETYDLGTATKPWREIYVSTSSINFVNPTTDTVIQTMSANSDGFSFGSKGDAIVSGSTISGSKLHIVGTAFIGGDLTLGDAASDSISISADLTSNLTPNADATYDLGSTSQGWNDLFLGSGGVINFNNGDVTVTHSSNLLSVAGGNTRVIRLELDSASDYLDVDTDLKVIAAADIILDPGGNNVLPGSDNADDLGASGTQWKDLYVHGIGYIDQLGTDADPVAIYVNSGELDGVTIGGESAAGATVTTLSATGDVDLGNATSDTITATARFDSDIVPSSDSTRDLGTSALQFAEAHIDTGYIDSLTTTTNVDIDDSGGDGAMDGVIIGAATPASATFTSMNTTGLTTIGDASGDTLTINAATINPTNIAAGTDNTVVVYNGSTLLTDEVDSRVWGTTLVDTDGSGTNNELATWSDSNSIIGEGNLTFDGSILTVTGNAVVSSHISASGDISGSSSSTGSFGRIQLASGGGVDIPDAVRLNFGDASDMKIYHSGTHSIIQDTGTGDLQLKGSAITIRGTSTGENMGVFTENGAVDLYYNGNKKFETTNTGVNITGAVTASTIDIDSIQGNWTNAGNTVADLGSITTVDINGGTINGITDLAVADGGTGASTLNDLITLTTHTTGNYVATITGGTGVDSTAATSGEGTTHTLSVDLNELTTETSIAQDDFVTMVDATDDGSGKITFSNLEDEIFGNVSGDIAIAAGGAATIQANSVALSTDTTGDYVGTITGGTGITSTAATSGEGTTHSLSVDASQTQITSVGTIGTGTWQGTTVAVNQGGTGVTTSTGTGNVVLSSSPTLVTPALGTPASGVTTNLTGNSGITGLGTQVEDLEMGGYNIQTAGVITLKEQAEADADVAGEGQLWVDTATPNVLYFTNDTGTDHRISFSTSAHLRGMLSDETGTGGAVFATSPTIVTPTIASFTNATHDHADAAGGGVIALGTATSGNYVGTITGGTGITSTAATSGEGTTHSLSVDASQTQITSVGTIGTGVWQGTTVAVDQGGTGATTLNNLITLGTHTTGNYVATIADSGGGGITVANSGAESAAVTLELDINGLTTDAIASGDFIAFSDEGEGGDPANKETIDDVATLFAGTGLTAASAVLGVDAAQTQITSIGTIGTGVWQGTAINDTYIDTINNANKVALTALDIDGGTDVGAAIVDADLIILDDGAGGTNRKATMSRLKTYMSGISGGSTLGNIQVGVTAAGEIDTSSGNLTIDSAGGTTTIDDAVTITGNLTVNGETTYVSSSAVSIGDRIVVLNAGNAPGDGGLYIIDTDATETGSLLWDVSEDRWIGGLKGSEVTIPTISSTDTFTNKTLTTPTIVAAGWANANHTHAGSTTGGQITLGTGTTGDYVSTAVAGSGIDVSGATGAVTISIGSSEVTNAMMADDAINSDEIVDGAVDNVHLANSSLTYTAGTGLTGGGAVSLGSSATLNVIGGDGITANANDIAVTAAQTTITSIYATDLIIGEDSQTAIDFGTANEIDFKINNSTELTLDASALYPVTDAGLDLGTSTLEFKDAFFDGTVTSDAFAGPLTGAVTGNADTATKISSITNSNIVQLTSSQTLTNKTLTSPDINGGTISAFTIDGNWTAASQTCANLGSVTTMDINGGDIASGVTINKSPVITLGGDLTGNVTLSALASGTLTATIAATSVEGSMLNDNIISGQGALGSASVAQADLLMIDDGPGTVKKVTFSNFEDSIFNNISGDIAIAAGGAVTIQATSVDNSMLAGSIANGKLSNSSLTYTAGTGLTGGGAVSLGGSATLNVIGGTGITANANDIALTNTAVTYTAGTGLTGGGAVDLGSSATLNVIGGNGITANADDMMVTAAQTTITSIINNGLSIGGYSSHQLIDFSTDDMIKVSVNNVADEFRFSAGGTFHADADVVAYSSTTASDVSLKKNITDTKYGLSDIMKLRGVDYDWKREDMGHDVGVLAHEVEAVIPEIVKEYDGMKGRPKFKAVDYNKLVPVLIESIKTLKMELEDLKKKVN